MTMGYTPAQNKIFLGGGGGCGHGNDLGEKAGGRGGGIVFITAGAIQTVGSGAITANGQNAPEAPPPAAPGYDGTGGGGAGGTVLLNTLSFTSAITVTAAGGKGADAYSNALLPDEVGPGGGGGGGAIWFRTSAQPANVTVLTPGGANGILPQYNNTAWGAQPGSNGSTALSFSAPPLGTLFVPAPPVTINDSIITCRNVHFAATGGSGSPTWNFGNGVTGSGNPVTYNYPAGGTYTVTVQYPGCGGSDTVVVTLPNSPVVTVAGPASICAGASGVLTATAPGADTFSWTPATGLNTTNGSTVTASPAATISYIVFAGVTATGCAATASHSLTVNPTPTVTAVSNPTTICEGASATLTASTSVPATYSWTPGGATQGITQVSPVTTTVYTVTATAAGCSATDTVHVSVLPKPQLALTTPTPSVCPQGTATLNATVNIPGGSFAWAPPISGTSSTVTTPAVTAPTTFSVFYTAPNGCKDTATQTIGVNPAPTVAISGPSLLCSGTGPATLSAAGAATYVWTPAQYLSSTSGTTVQSLPPIGTSITYTVTGTDVNNCTATAQHTLAVEQSPEINAGPDTATCSGTPIVLSAGGVPSIAWTPTNSTAFGDSIIVLETVTANTTYTYIATGTVGACSDSDTVTLTVRALPTVLTTPKTAFVCRYDSARLTATGAVMYAWSPTMGLSNPANSVTMAKPDGPTTYTVTGTDAFGCVNSDTARVNINEALPVKASGDGQPISCDNSLAQLHATGAASYVWSPGQYLNDSTMAHPVATPPQTMQFTVIGSNSAGCTGRDTITVVSLKESTLAIPNIFTPNGDGLNDRVFPKVQCDFHFKQWSIYNRWGQRVYFSTDETKGWDGHFNGGLCDVGVYVFVVEGTGDAGDAKKLTGNITLMH